MISPLLANLYLNPLDHQMAGKGYEMVRYADDLVVLCRSREGAEPALAELRVWSEEAGLTLHPTKTRIVNVQNEAFDFLGWHFREGKKWPRKKSLEKLRLLTRRTNGQGLGETIALANPILRGWHNYFRESYPSGLRGPDGWLRRRLRAMLRKREKLPGYGRSQTDSQRWPNRWSAAHGSFSLEHGSCAYGLPHRDPTNWRAGCGKSARPVRWERRGASAIPAPITRYAISVAHPYRSF